jgi:hypothetical protein
MFGSVVVRPKGTSTDNLAAYPSLTKLPLSLLYTIPPKKLDVNSPRNIPPSLADKENTDQVHEEPAGKIPRNAKWLSVDKATVEILAWKDPSYYGNGGDVQIRALGPMHGLSRWSCAVEPCQGRARWPQPLQQLKMQQPVQQLSVCGCGLPYERF